MSMNSSNSWLKPFLAGILTTLAAAHVRRSLLPNSKNERRKDAGGSDGAPSKRAKAAPSDDGEERLPMDSPKLDKRILRKAEAALLNRTSRLIIVVERCTNDHNYSAILRSAEALGVQHVYIIAPECINQTLRTEDADADGGVDGGVDGDAETKTLHRSTGQRVKHASASEVNQRAMHHLFAQRALEWLTVTEFDTTAQCIQSLKQDGYDIWSTDLSQEAECLTREGLGLPDRTDALGNTDGVRLPEKIAVVFGTEAVGCTSEILSASSRRIYLPLRGYADSLNLSVATALVVHQLFVLDPTLIGAMGDDERKKLRRKWYGKLAGQRLETRGEKADRKRLLQTVRAAERLRARDEEWRRREDDRHNGVAADENEKTVAPLTKEQLQKVNDLPAHRAALLKLDTDLAAAAHRAVEACLENPPPPLGDMRRADEHRTTFAGKGAKERHGDAWKDMPATGYYRTGDGRVDGSAAFFRGMLKEAGGAGVESGGSVGGGTDRSKQK